MPDLDLRQLVPLALSINTIVLMWLAGSKNVAAWVLGLVGQAGWFAFVVLFDAWGLLPLCIALTIVYARNLLRWRREERRRCTTCFGRPTDPPCCLDRQAGTSGHTYAPDGPALKLPVVDELRPTPPRRPPRHDQPPDRPRRHP